MQTQDIRIIGGLLGALIILFVIGAIINQTDTENELVPVTETRDLMDTFVSMTVYAADQSTGSAAIQEAYDSIQDIIDIASRYDAEAEVYRLNAEGQLQDPSPELIEMIELSMEYNQITSGTFDITILPLLDLWSKPLTLFTINISTADLNAGGIPETLEDAFSDYSPALYDLVETPIITITDSGWTLQSSWQQYFLIPTKDSVSVSTNFWYLPSDSQEYFINQTKELLGNDKITITEDLITLAPGCQITLDGIAKGFAVDKALEALEDQGISYALINAGGDIVTLQGKPDGSAWTTALVNPHNRSQYLTTFSLTGKAVATSGNYERYFDENADVGHILDPRSGRTAAVASSSTVIAESCTIADILATACFVLGPEEGLTLVEDLDNVETMILDYEDPSIISQSSGMNCAIQS